MKREFDTQKKEYTLSILVQDIPGVLSQVARLFSRKGYNIESIVSGETDRPHVTRITIVLLADELMINQIAAQCRKLIPVLAVKILDEGTSIQREFSLIKVHAADRNARDEVMNQDPLGAFSIHGFTYDITRILTYYEVELRITAKADTPEQAVGKTRCSPGASGKLICARSVDLYAQLSGGMQDNRL